MKGFFKFILFLVLLCVAYWFLIVKGGHPSNDKDWSVDQAILPYADINGDAIRIYNVRNFFYRSASDYDANYYDATFDLAKLQSVDFVMVPFSSNPGAAHVFLSFGFSDGRYVAISPEIRKEKGETFSAFKGLFNKYELMYVIADERDVIGLRANHRKEKVYVYPANADKEKAKKLFVDMLQRADALYDKPEFYNTIFNSCSTNLAQHINKVSPGKLGLDMRILTPGKADEMAFENGLIATDLSLSEAKKRYLVNDPAGLYRDSLNFSQKIREGR